jgi:hypothetical protein
VFSALPKVADKQFVIGFLIPLLSFVLVLGVALRPWSEVTSLAQAMWADKDIGPLAVVTAGLWVGAMGLMLTNRLIQRLLQGYWWPLTVWFGKTLLLEKHKALRARIDASADALGPKPLTDPNGAWEAKVREHNMRLIEFRRRFPRESADVLGTRFGNAVRAYERYPNLVYGVDGVTIWPRLVGVVSKDVQGLLGDARAQVDCFVNLAVLALLVAAVAGVSGAARAMGYGEPGDRSVTWLISWAVGALVAAWLGYEMAIERAVACGEQVRAAFDLFLPKLVAALSYDMPKGQDALRELWSDLSQSYLFFQPALRPWSVKPPSEAPAPGPEPEHPDDDAS